MKYLFATNNPGKIKEIKTIFEAIGLEVITLSDLGLSFEPDEDGDTFEENAMQKAVETADFIFDNGLDDIAVLADDSGLCVTALNGEPGVDSANFMGRETPYEVRNAHIVNELANAADRSAKFMCVIACAFPNGVLLTTEGEVVGEIAAKPDGIGGFGYDPIFFLPDKGKTMAQLSASEKNDISHRGAALSLMLEALKDEKYKEAWDKQ